MNEKASNEINLPVLHKLIQDSFNKDELQKLCFDLGINYENIAGNTLDGKIRELIEFLNRHQKLIEAIGLISNRRPNIDWSQIYGDELTKTNSEIEIITNSVDIDQTRMVGYRLED